MNTISFYGKQPAELTWNAILKWIKNANSIKNFERMFKIQTELRFYELMLNCVTNKFRFLSCNLFMYHPDNLVFSFNGNKFI